MDNIIVSSRYLRFAIAPICSPDGEVETRMYDIQGDDLPSIENLLNDIVKPYYLQLNSVLKEAAKNSIQYYLSNKDEHILEWILETAPFKLPVDVFGFWETMWRVLFSDEEYKMADCTKYMEERDEAKAEEYLDRLFATQRNKRIN